MTLNNDTFENKVLSEINCHFGIQVHEPLSTMTETGYSNYPELNK